MVFSARIATAHASNLRRRECYGFTEASVLVMHRLVLNEMNRQGALKWRGH